MSAPRGTADHISIPLIDLNGAGVTGATLVTTISKDGGAFVATVNVATEPAGSMGSYDLLLTAEERDCTKLEVQATDGVVGTKIICYPSSDVPPVANVDTGQLATNLAPLMPAPEVTVNPTPVTVDTDEAALAAAIAPLIPAPEVTVNPTPVTVDTDEPALAAAIAALIPAPEVTVNPTVLDPAERTAIANEVELQIIDEADTEQVLTAIVNKINQLTDLDTLTLAAIEQALQSALTDYDVPTGADVASIATLTLLLQNLVAAGEIRVGNGLGDTLYTDNIVANGQAVRRGIVKAFPYVDGVADFSTLSGMDHTDSEGYFELFLNAGSQYVLRVEKNGTVMKTDIITVGE